jgi:hypothetical protein
LDLAIGVGDHRTLILEGRGERAKAILGVLEGTWR